jgi:hypothetical protein
MGPVNCIRLAGSWKIARSTTSLLSLRLFDANSKLQPRFFRAVATVSLLDCGASLTQWSIAPLLLTAAKALLCEAGHQAVTGGAPPPTRRREMHARGKEAPLNTSGAARCSADR